MAAKVTQVFSTLLTLKSVHQSLKKSTNAQESEIKSAIVEIKSIEDFLTNNATELEYLVKISTMVPTKLPSSSEMISEGLMRLL
jgi:DNA-binding protein H-NS